MTSAIGTTPKISKRKNVVSSTRKCSHSCRPFTRSLHKVQMISLKDSYVGSKFQVEAQGWKNCILYTAGIGVCGCEWGSHGSYITEQFAAILFSEVTIVLTAGTFCIKVNREN